DQLARLEDETLEISGEITPQCVEALAQMPRLRWLQIDISPDISLSDLQGLAASSTLEGLYLFDGVTMDRPGLEKLANWPRLRIIVLPWMARGELSFEQVEAIAKPVVIRWDAESYNDRWPEDWLEDF